MTSSLRNWASGEGGRIAQNLGKGLQLPKDVHYFSDGSDEALAVRLQWHSIAVTSLTCFFVSSFATQIYVYIFPSFPFYFLFFIIIDIVVTSSAVGLYDRGHIE